jgi:hypothetical protein
MLKTQHFINLDVLSIINDTLIFETCTSIILFLVTQKKDYNGRESAEQMKDVHSHILPRACQLW